MLLLFVRTIFIYFLVLVVMRCMGKREINQLQPFELVISIMIADLATVPMSDAGTPMLYGIIPILGLLLVHIIISTLNLKSIKFRRFICGKPRILIKRGKIDEDAMIKENITLNELQERFRVNGIINIEDVEYAILETSGQVSIIPKPGKRNVTPDDLKIEAEYIGMPYDLVIDGNVMYDNLKKLGKNYIWLKTQVEKFGMKPEEALIVVMSGNGSIFCQKKER